MISSLRATAKKSPSRLREGLGEGVEQYELHSATAPTPPSYLPPQAGGEWRASALAMTGLVIVLLSLAACGVKGDLKRPAEIEREQQKRQHTQEQQGNI